jgi:hypothetical protein
VASASWARGYFFVNTVGMDEDLIRRYVRYREEEEKKRERQRGGLRFVFMRRDPLSGVAIGTDRKPPPLGVVVHLLSHVS